MNTALFYDTETTGLPDFKAPSEAEHQPHIVQLCGVLVDLDTRTPISMLDVIVRPEGWEIPAEISAIHGIDNDLANAVGVSEKTAIELFMQLWRGPGQVRIAHNEQFDARILRIGLKRHFNLGDETQLADEWKSGISKCTARMSTPIINLPPTPKMIAANMRKPKTPNLGEAYKHFTGNDLENAHSAFADTMACVQVYFGILDHLDGLEEKVA